MGRKETKRFNFTDARLGSLATPREAVKMYDMSNRNLGLKLLPSGKRQFFWSRAVPEISQPERAVRPTWKTIGEYPGVSIIDARKKATDFDKLLGDWKAKGCPYPNPFVDEVRSEMTFGEAVEDYFAKGLRAKAHRPDVAVREARYRVDKHLKQFSTRQLSTISKGEIRGLHDKITDGSGFYAANAIVRLVRTVYNHAIRNEKFAGANPAAKIQLPKEPPRERFLQRDELPRLFAALKSEPNPDLVDFVNMSLWTGHANRTFIRCAGATSLSTTIAGLSLIPKGGQAYVVALTKEAVAILEKRKNDKKRKNDSMWVFPSVGRSGHIADLTHCWRKMLKRAGITDFRMHDLRRTFASWQALQGTSLLIVGKSLGHKSTAATQVYARLSLDPVRESVSSATRS